MHPSLKHSLDMQLNQCESKVEECSFLIELGQMAINKNHMEILKILIKPISEVEQIREIKRSMAKTSEIIAYANDTMIFRGYADLEGFDKIED